MAKLVDIIFSDLSERNIEEKIFRALGSVSCCDEYIPSGQYHLGIIGPSGSTSDQVRSWVSGSLWSKSYEL